MKKIELHLHLDGSVNLTLASTLSKLDLNIVKNKMIAPFKCKNLGDYLTRFDFPISLMQTKENLELIASKLADDLINDKVIYAEIRFNPLAFTSILTLDEVITSVLRGLNNKKIKTNLILCMMRGYSHDDNLKIINLAKKYLGKGVVAIDLAGDEKKYKLKEYLSLFEYAKSLNIPFTIHAGETDKIDILSAINLGARRIGHGVFSITDENLIQELRKKDILLEVCPTSNIQTNAFNTYLDHPIKKLYDLNIKINLSTDNMTVSNTTLEKEYEIVKKYNNLTDLDLLKMNKDSIDYAFLSDLEKEELRKQLDILD